MERSVSCYPHAILTKRKWAGRGLDEQSCVWGSGKSKDGGIGQDLSKAPGVDGVGPSSYMVVGEVVPVQCTFIHLC